MVKSMVQIQSLTSLCLEQGTSSAFLIVIILHNETPVFVSSLSYSLKTRLCESSISFTNVLFHEYGLLLLYGLIGL